jgi:hypothetical protein
MVAASAPNDWSKDTIAATWELESPLGCPVVVVVTVVLLLPLVVVVVVVPPPPPPPPPPLLCQMMPPPPPPPLLLAGVEAATELLQVSPGVMVNSLVLGTLVIESVEEELSQVNE